MIIDRSIDRLIDDYRCYIDIDRLIDRLIDVEFIH
jgi:hypothetical protein